MQPPLTHFPLASRFNRLLGQFLDGLICWAPFVITVFLASFSNILAAVFGVAGIAWGMFYYLFADALTGGQSLAKRWLGMQVISVSTGAPCTFGQSLIRNSLTILGPIDWVFIFGERRQRLGDIAAGTIVIAD